MAIRTQPQMGRNDNTISWAVLAIIVLAVLIAAAYAAYHNHHYAAPASPGMVTNQNAPNTDTTHGAVPTATPNTTTTR